MPHPCRHTCFTSSDTVPRPTSSQVNCAHRVHTITCSFPNAHRRHASANGTRQGFASSLPCWPMLCTVRPGWKGLWHDTGFASLPRPPMAAFEISCVPSHRMLHLRQYEPARVFFQFARRWCPITFSIRLQNSSVCLHRTADIALCTAGTTSNMTTSARSYACLIQSRHENLSIN